MRKLNTNVFMDNHRILGKWIKPDSKDIVSWEFFEDGSSKHTIQLRDSAQQHALHMNYKVDGQYLVDTQSLQKAKFQIVGNMLIVEIDGVNHYFVQDRS